MYADVLLEMIRLISFFPRNRFHQIWNLDHARNGPFILDWARAIRCVANCPAGQRRKRTE